MSTICVTTMTIVFCCVSYGYMGEIKYEGTNHIAIFVLEVILADVVLVLLRLIDDNKLVLNQLGELYLTPLFGDCQLSLFELGDRDDIVVFVVILSGLGASRCPDQSPLSRQSRISGYKISLKSRV